MSATEIFANQPFGTVTSGPTDPPPVQGTNEIWTVFQNPAAPFPDATTDETQFHITDTDTTAASEIILVTNIVSTTWYVTRGAEGTTPVSHEVPFTITQVLTAGWLSGVSSGVNAVDNGGTGLATAAAYALLAGGTSSTSPFQQVASLGSSGQVLTSQGAGSLPSWTSQTGLVNPMTTHGDTIYENAALAPAALAGNVTSTKNFLTSTGSGGTANSPAWGTIAAADVPAATSVTQGAVTLGGTTATSVVPTGTFALNVMDFGATGNGKRSFHGAMTSTSSTLNISPDSKFAAGDIGKLVMVDQAAGTGTPLAGTIAGFTSGSVVTISAAASNTVSGVTVYWGTDDTVAIQSALTTAQATGTDDSLALLSTAQPVYFPYAIYMTSAPVIPTQSKSVNLTGGQATIVATQSALLNFNGIGHLLEGVVDISDLWFEGCGGHIFENANIHGEVTIQRCNFVARNAAYGIWYQDDVVNSSSTSLYKATFRDVTYWIGAGTRSVEPWHFLTSLGADLTDITFENVNGPNPPGAGPTPLDNTQYQFFLSTSDPSYAITNITWRNCLTASCYGGYIKVLGARDVIVDGIDFYNTYTTSVSNDLITFGKTATNSIPSRFITVRNITRNNALGTGSPPPPYDISFDATCFEVLAEQCTGGSPFCINLNGCAGALLIGNNSSTSGGTFTLSNIAADTMIIDRGKLAIGTTAVGPLTISDAGVSGTFASLVSVTNTTSSPSNAPVGFWAASAGDQVIGIRVTGDTATRFRIQSDGTLEWGPGGGTTQDTRLHRTATGVLTVDDAGHGNSVTLAVTASTAQTTSTALSTITANASGAAAQTILVTGDTVPRFEVDSSGKHQWGAGGTVAVDTNLYRVAAGTLRTDSNFAVAGTITGATWAGNPVSGQFLSTYRYNPTTQTGFPVSSTTPAAFGSGTIATQAFTAPPSGNVLVTMNFMLVTSTSGVYVAMYLSPAGSTTTISSDVIQYESPAGGFSPQQGFPFMLTGLNPGTSYNYDLIGSCTSGQSGTIVAYTQTSYPPTLGTTGVRGGPVVVTIQAISPCLASDVKVPPSLGTTAVRGGPVVVTIQAV